MVLGVRGVQEARELFFRTLRRENLQIRATVLHGSCRGRISIVSSFSSAEVIVIYTCIPRGSHGGSTM